MTAEALVDTLKAENPKENNINHFL